MQSCRSAFRRAVVGSVFLGSALIVSLLGGPVSAQQDPSSSIPPNQPVHLDPLEAIDGVPVCAEQGDTLWHSAVERTADGSITCTHGHEHGDNPHALDATFGPMGAWWNGGTEQDISYPWETMLENEQKHTAYKIVVRGSDAQPLQPWYTTSGENYIRAFRGEYHLDGTKGFVMSEYHSFGFEAQVCSRDGNCGIARFGGVQDLGERVLTHANNTFTCLFPNPNIPANMGLCGTNGTSTFGPRSMAGGPADSRHDQTWYGSNNQQHALTGSAAIDLDFGVILGSVWSPVIASNPMASMSPDPNVRGDYTPHASGHPAPNSIDDWHHGTFVNVSALNMALHGFPTTTGRVTASGYTDRYGNVVDGCTAMGPECVPFQLTNVPVGLQGFRDDEYVRDTQTPSQVENYDVVNPATGNSLVAWPN